MPFLIAALGGAALSLFGLKAVDNATKPPASTLASPTLPYYIMIPLIVGGTVGVIILIKKIAN